jgi:hypothetical protein
MKRESILIIILIAFFIFLNFAFMTKNDQLKERRSVVPYSSYNNSPKGLKALFMLIEKLGYQPKRLHNPYLRRSRQAGPGLLMLIQPSTSFSERESQKLLEWVKSGNTLLIALDEQTNIAAKLGFELVEITEGISSPASKPERRRPVARPAHLTTLNFGIDNLNVKPIAYIKRQGSGVRGQGSVKEEKDLTDTQSNTRHPTSDFVEHFKINEGAILISYKLGLGKVIVTCRPEVFDNLSLGNPNNLKLIANLLNYEAKGKKIYFDEFHHGFGQQETLMDLLRSTSIGWAILQFSVVVVLWAYSLSRRFSRPLPLKAKVERSSIEYVNAMSNIYSSAQAKAVALSILRARFERTLKLHPKLRNQTSTALLEEFQQMLQKCKGERLFAPMDSELVELIRRISHQLKV